MTQALAHDTCRHGYLPGGCTDNECRNSLRAKRLYVDETRPLQLALRDAQDRIRSLERRLAAATGERPHHFDDRAMRFADIVASIYGITREGLLHGGRWKVPAEARKVLYYVCRTVPEPRWSFPEIAMVLGGKDHTTIIHGIRRIEYLMTKDAHLERRVQRAVYAARIAEGQRVEPIAMDWVVPDVPDLEV